VWIRTWIYDNFSQNSWQNEKFLRQNWYKESKHAMYVEYLTENRSFYEISWKIWHGQTAINYNIIWRMCFACWINKTTDTHSEYVTLIAFPRQTCLREIATMLRYTYIVSFIFRLIFGKQKTGRWNWLSTVTNRGLWYWHSQSLDSDANQSFKHTCIIKCT
jgi:hypothetical protein